MTRLTTITLAAGLAAGLGTGAAKAQDCAAIEDMKLEATNLISAVEVEAAEDLPGYCRVLGYVRPAINFEVRLPLEDWNGKFYMAGCGGFCGSLASDAPGFINAINYALKRDYAVATMDGGHWGESSADGRWAMADPVAEVDWGWRAVEETTRVAKAITEAYYATAPEYAYFQGCSTGGRQANMVALRTPEAYDGIISGAPALDYPGLVGSAFAWIAQANTGPDGAAILKPEDAAVVADAVVAACDAVDGVEDGMVADPAACAFDPATLEEELGAEKVAVLEKWYSPAKNSDGEALYPAAVPVGSEPYWSLWLTGFAEGGGALVPRAFGPNFLQYMAFPDDTPPGWTIQDFDFDEDPARMDAAAATYNSDDPDLTAFAEAGGKLLMWHGWADAIVFPGKTVEYFEALTEMTGDEFARLFMIPGMDHCGILATGPGIDQSGFDPLSALEAWVEGGTPPEALTTTKTAEGGTGWSRPVCAYPAEATHTGDGDWREAGNWTCEE
jgi:feruloyl esterase